MSSEPQLATMNDLRLTRDGYSALVLGNIVYAAVGFRDEIAVCDAFLRSKPVEEMTIDQFTRNGTYVKDLPAFVAEINDLAVDNEQVARLGRIRRPSKTSTDWGTSQNAVIYARGIIKYETAGHGGFKVSKTVNEKILEPYRNTDDDGIGWYEEDTEWAKVAASFPYLFTDRELRNAERTLRDWHPFEYEKVNGVVIPEGESRVKDEHLFKERHANDWIVISAKQSDEHEGMARCTATVGGKRSYRENGKDYVFEEKDFLVPLDEYRARPKYGFVIDPERHQELDAAAAPGM